MVKDLVRTAGMSNKEVMYIVASEWIDEICMVAVGAADKFMENEFFHDVVFQAAEQILRYRDIRKDLAMGVDREKLWYEWYERDVSAYKTVLYDCFFRKFGANNSGVA